MLLKISTAKNLVRKTWSESAGNKVTKHHFNRVIKKFYPGKSGSKLKNFYKNLLPYIKRDVDLEEIEKEDFIENSFVQANNIDAQIISEEMSILGKMVALCGGDAKVFENTYGQSYEDYRSTIK
ncbi:MAG: hypothetical protein MRY57_02715 [Candidatus Pacebacteria bacterium]|nr:hypothetical protein [Candidatus Paceibacterota bacterium]